MNYKRLVKMVQAKSGLTMRKLARELDVTEATIYTRISKNNPTYSQLEALAKVAGVTVIDLLKWVEG